MDDFDLDALRMKSRGTTFSEKLLHQLCEDTLLSMWCFSNPYTIMKTKKELCDVLIVFKNHIFLFSDKEAMFHEDEPVETAWNRWYRCTVLGAAKQLVGAERQIRRTPENIFVDKDCCIRFPFQITINENTRFHRIIVARGAKKACQSFLEGGHGSLIVDSRIVGDSHLFKIRRDGTPEPQTAIPFAVGFPLDANTVFHVFDDFTTEVILGELDSLSDFADYLTEKELLLEAGNGLWADGEEDILAQYLSRVENDQHIIMTEEEKSRKVLCDFKPFWDSFVQSNQYQAKKAGDEISYLWDALIEKFYRNVVAETTEARTFDRYEQLNALFTPFAELTRIERRMISQAILSGYNDSVYALQGDETNRFLTFTRTVMSSLCPGKFCLLLFAKWPDKYSLEEYKKERREKLEFSLRLCKHRNPKASQIIGLAFSNDRSKDSSEDMMVMDVDAWTNADDAEIQFMLDHGIKDNLGQKAASTSSQEYSNIYHIEEVAFPWADS